MSPGAPSPPRAEPPPIRGEVIVEFVQAGAYLRCAAIHVDTATEVSATGPVSAGRHTLERIALGKLKRALAAQS